MKILDGLLEFFGSVLPAFCLAVVLIVVTINVIARTIFGLPFHVAHDVAILAFSGVVWFGLVGVAASRQLFGVAFFVSLLPSKAKKAALIIAHLIVIAICCFVIDAAYHQIMTSRFSKFLALGWPKWIVSAVLLFSFVIVVLIQVRQIIDVLMVKTSKKEKTIC
ncbi:TRAP transporter small permease [Pseudochrobactrum sp. MP213Fo]|uniref:TRAP transporter small permease n=1 Tax=Pseudochrobactrum sp. MP213Fo TaxID=3022250 RepID=UPI003BA3AD94